MKNILIGLVIAGVVAVGGYTIMQNMSSYADLVFTGNYIAYDKTQNQIDSDKITVLDFYASRCPTCVASHNNFLESIDQLPDNMQILNVNYDTADELKKKYDITSQHTFVLVDREGNMIKKEKGLNTIADVVAFASQEIVLSDKESLPEGEVEQTMVDEESLVSQDGDSQTIETNTIPGIYTDYESGRKFIGDKSKRVVLFFHASRCPTCIVAKKNILAQADNISSDLVILELDYDTQTALKKKYGVVTQTTYIVLDNAGNMIKKTNGLTTLESIDTFAQ